MVTFPDERLRTVNGRPLRSDGDYVLYWMIANRRVRWNFSLQRAIELAAELRKPLLILEALRCDYPWASDRLHRFILQGMADNRSQLAGLPVRYYPFVERAKGDGRGLLEALAADACAVVTDDFPSFFLPQVVAVAGRKLKVRLEAVDSNGLLPMRATDREFARAHDFRRWLQKHLLTHLEQPPKPAPFQGHRLRPAPSVPAPILQRWPEATDSLLAAAGESLSELPIDHDVGPAAFDGGMLAAGRCLQRFLRERLEHYAEDRNHPDCEATSGLSPYLHFGHISAHEVFFSIAERESWSPASVSGSARGARTGWWGMSESAEGFLDELITWRELGFNMCSHRDDYDHWDSLPEWARQTLQKHADDPRPHLYSLEELEAARTADDVWNAAQNQLVQEGRLQNYMRMLWGKKVLEWSRSPQEALQRLIHLNNKYAVDGRDPNSYSGIFWVFGRYDRPWGPERPIYGKVRYMSSENTVRKLRTGGYLQQYAT